MTKLDNTRAVDECVGKNLRNNRKKKGLSQHEVAEMVGLTFQQIQKYEKGLNRISCSKLWQFSQIFGVPVSCFFHGIGKNSKKYTFPQEGDSNTYSAEDSGGNLMEDLMTLDFMILQSLEKIDNVKFKEGVLNLIRTMGRES